MSKKKGKKASPKNGDPFFAGVMKSKRKEKMLSQSALAEKSGIELRTIRNYEQCVSEPMWLAAIAIANALGLSLDSLCDPVRRNQTEDTSRVEGDS